MARAALEKMTIRAPIDGTVLQINAQAGECGVARLAAAAARARPISRRCACARNWTSATSARSRSARSVTVRATAFPRSRVRRQVSSIAPLVEPGRLEPPGSRNLTDVDVVRVMIALTGSGDLTTGMKADIYFRSGQEAER